MRRLAALTVFVALAGGAQAETRRLVAGGARPVHDAVMQLGARHGWSICYEETRLRYPADHDQGEPKPGVLVLDYDPAAGRAAVARRLVQTYNKRPDATSRFRVVQLAGRSVVQVTEVRNEQGQWAPAKSPLSYPVTLKKGDWVLMGILDEMEWQLSLHAGFKVHMTPGLASMGLFQWRAVISAEAETARSVLARFLTRARNQVAPVTGYDADWQLICGGSYGCALRIHRSKPPTIPPPSAGTALPPMGPLNRPRLPIK